MNYSLVEAFYRSLERTQKALIFWEDTSVHYVVWKTSNDPSTDDYSGICFENGVPYRSFDKDDNDDEDTFANFISATVAEAISFKRPIKLDLSEPPSSKDENDDDYE